MLWGLIELTALQNHSMKAVQFQQPQQHQEFARHESAKAMACLIQTRA
jgi:hypothetical protein